MMNLVMRTQIYTVVGCMLSRWKAWFVIKFWTIWYYIWNPNMYFKRIKLRNDMINDNNSDWNKITNWLGVAVIGSLWWWSLFANGLWSTIVWTIVFIALGALWFTMRNNRV